MSKKGEPHPYRRPVSFILDIRRTDHAEVWRKLEQVYNKSEYARSVLMESLGVKPGTGVDVAAQPKSVPATPQPQPVASVKPPMVSVKPEAEAPQPAVRQQSTSEEKPQRKSKLQGAGSKLRLSNMAMRNN